MTIIAVTGCSIATGKQLTRSYRRARYRLWRLLEDPSIYLYGSFPRVSDVTSHHEERFNLFLFLDFVIRFHTKTRVVVVH